MVLENKVVNIDSDNEILGRVEYDNDGMLVCDELERKYKENLQVEGLQGVKFSLNVVVGGEEMASCEYLEDEKSANRVPWIFCALHRWCSNYELVSPAYIERECVAWCCCERYFERKRGIEIFKVNRNYEEFMERLGVEMMYNYNEYLPWIKDAVIRDDVTKDDNMNYRSVADNTEGDRTVPDHDELYENVENYKNLNGMYSYDTNIRYPIINKLCIPKIRLLFDDGG